MSMLSNAVFEVPRPQNEPVRAYLPGSPERASLKAELDRQVDRVVDIPLVIGGKAVYTDNTFPVSMPHDHGHLLARCSLAGPEHLEQAVRCALEARESWARTPFHERAAIFLRAAQRIAGPMRDTMNAATMLGQSKTAYQAEIDAACELVDFLRFNAHFADGLLRRQPDNAPGVWNRQVYRPLDGFVTAITPFNFTAIAGNLGAAPALMGNTVVWKPASTAVLSNYYYMQVLLEAGLPAGVINFVPSRGAEVGERVISHPALGGIHFTGSTQVFRSLWSGVGQNIGGYRSYPRLVGETGGKDFVFAHPSADVDALVSGLVRGAFEYQGQKCSAASRAFVPAGLWPSVRDRMLAEIAALGVGDVRDFTNFMGAVIDRPAYDSITGYVKRARNSPDNQVLCGGCDDKKGYFIQPTVIQCAAPDSETMVQEIFGPVLSVYVYGEDRLEETLARCASLSDYALTGAVYAEDRAALARMCEALGEAAGNLYINDKPTGAVVGQQPFGGGRASGTNDKAGSEFNLIRWVNLLTVKETLLPVREIGYPYMAER